MQCAGSHIERLLPGISGRRWITGNLPGENRIRADGNSVIPDLQVQMVTIGPSGGSHFSNYGICIYFLTLLNIDFGKVGIEGGYLVAVINNNRVTVCIFGGRNILNPTLLNRSDRISRKPVKVDSRVK